MVIAAFGCSVSKEANNPVNQPAQRSAIPNYRELYNWAAHPAKYDLSDSTPRPYRDFVKDTSVDVFFIHPTTYTLPSALTAPTPESDKSPWNARLNDSAINLKTGTTSMLFQASAFNRYRVFAPRYRQAHIRAFYISDSVAAPYFDTAYADVRSAFRWYLENENEGRPFIIAAHSQGTLHAGRLIRDTIENSALLDQMVAAYIIGLPVPENYFANCAPCSTATQNNCFVSWRTYQEGHEPASIKHEPFKAVVVNPLTWTTDTATAPKKLNHGAVLFKFNKPIKHAVSATVHGNILWASKPQFLGSVFFKRTNYHIGDINLFWKNIRENTVERVNAFKKKNGEMKGL